MAQPTDSLAPAGARPIEGVIADLLAGTKAGKSAAAEVLADLSRIDAAAYRAIASTPTPALDEPLRRLSNMANRSLLWITIAGAMALLGGRRGRQAAVMGLASMVVSSAVVNIGLKNLSARQRPDRESANVLIDRYTKMPASTSFPSGHSAAGFAFASGVAREMPWLSIPLRVLAAAVAYSRVHSGVHYPGDAVAGSLVGSSIGLLVGHEIERLRSPR